MMKKIVIFMTVFLMFDRFIQHKIFVGRKQQLLAMNDYEKTIENKKHGLHGLRKHSFA